jgi:hypothetical protein
MNRRITLTSLNVVFLVATFVTARAGPGYGSPGYMASVLAATDFFILAGITRMWSEFRLRQPNMIWLYFTIAAFIPGGVLTIASFGLVRVGDSTAFDFFLGSWLLATTLSLAGRIWTGTRFESWLRRIPAAD